MVNLFIALALVIIPALAHSEEAALTPLEQTMALRLNWGDEASEVAYVGSRCSALYSAVGTYFISNGTTQRDKIDGEDLRTRSNVMGFASVIFGKLAKLEQEDTQNRIKVIFTLYLKKMAASKMLLNNALETPIAEDLMFCNQHEHNYVKIMQMYQIELEKSKRKK
jgi:hypothetical protein